MKSVAVIGAGIAGITTAYYLVKEGYKVVVFDQERYAAMRTSYSNGGQISVSNSEVWTTWSNVIKGAKWIFKKDAPLLIGTKLDYDKFVWISKFLLTTISNDYARNTVTTIQLGLESRSLYNKIIEEENLKFDQSNCGILHFYKDQKYYNQAVLAKNLYNANNVEWDIINPDQINKLEPNLQSQNIIGGAWTKSDWTGDIHLFCNNLKTILECKYDVKFVFDNKIYIKTLDSTFDYVVVCAGVGSIEISKDLKEKLPIYPVKGYSITINDVDPALLPKVSLLDDQAKIVTSTLGNRLRVAGTAEFAGENYDIKKDRIDPLLNWVKVNLPQISTKNYSPWTCLRPMTPNMLPIIKQSDKNKKIFYNTGHGHLGWTLSPATAKQLINLINAKENK